MDPKIFLVDGSNYIYRAYYGNRSSAIAQGVRTNAVQGFASMITNLVREHAPSHMAVVFDPPRASTFRSQLYPQYKANRQDMPEDLVPQIPLVKELIDALNVARFEEPLYEADDVLATLARIYAEQGHAVTVVTGDKDLMQIVGQRVSLLDTQKGALCGVEQVLERFGVVPEKVPDVLGLSGDTSDNIPGVPGIGEKTAAELVKRFGSLEKVLEWTHLVSGKKRQKNLWDFADQARLSKTLATIKNDVPLQHDLQDLRVGAPDLAVFKEICTSLALESLVQQYEPPEKGVVEIYTDGSAVVDGPGGYGVVLRFGEAQKEISGSAAHTTSQRMELMAAIAGLQALTKPSRVRLVSDSQYLVKGMSEWLKGWINSGRLDEPGALANQDLWKQLAALAQKHQITWEWVRGHAGHVFNERADVLAGQAMKAQQTKD